MKRLYDNNTNSIIIISSSSSSSSSSSNSSSSSGSDDEQEDHNDDGDNKDNNNDDEENDDDDNSNNSIERHSWRCCSLRRELSPTHTLQRPGTIVCAWRATHRTFITCNMPCARWYKGTAQLLDSSAIKFDRAEISLVLFHRLKPITDQEGEETGVPLRNPKDELQKMPQTKARKSKPQPRLEQAL